MVAGSIGKGSQLRRRTSASPLVEPGVDHDLGVPGLRRGSGFR